MTGMYGLQRHVLSAHAWESSVNAAINAAINGGATVDALDYAFTRYVNDQTARGLAYLGLTQLVREQIAQLQQQARGQAANAPAPERETPAEEPIKPPGLKVQTAHSPYPRHPHSQDPEQWWTAELDGMPATRQRADTRDEAWTLGMQMQAEWLAAEKAKRDPADDVSDLKRDDLRVVAGHTGVYQYALADGRIKYAAKWPDSSKASGTATKRGFDSAEAAAEFRAQTTTPEAVAA